MQQTKESLAETKLVMEMKLFIPAQKIVDIN